MFHFHIMNSTLRRWTEKCPVKIPNIIDDIGNPYSHLSILYIGNVLIHSHSILATLEPLIYFFNIIKKVGLIISAKKWSYSTKRIRLLD